MKFWYFYMVFWLLYSFHHFYIDDFCIFHHILIKYLWYISYHIQIFFCTISPFHKTHYQNRVITMYKFNMIFYIMLITRQPKPFYIHHALQNWHIKFLRKKGHVWSHSFVNEQVRWWGEMCKKNLHIHYDPYMSTNIVIIL